MVHPDDRMPEEPRLSDEADIDPLSDEELDEVAGGDGTCSIMMCSSDHV